MSLNVTASQAFLKGLRDAYTGKLITVTAISAGDRSPLYFSSDAFDPANFLPTPEALFAALGTRGSIIGAARNGRELVCPYTGQGMSVEAVKGFGYRAIGGFSPSEPKADPVDFARACLMRDGKVPKKAPRHPPAVKARVVIEIEPPSAKTGLSDAAAIKAEGMLRDLAPRKLTVPVSGLRRDGRGK